jgi:hypothetical protein
MREDISRDCKMYKKKGLIVLIYRDEVYNIRV